MLMFGITFDRRIAEGIKKKLMDYEETSDIRVTVHEVATLGMEPKDSNKVRGKGSFSLLEEVDAVNLLSIGLILYVPSHPPSLSLPN